MIKSGLDQARQENITVAVLERLASLTIMGAQLMASHRHCYVVLGFQKGSHLGPNDAERRPPLGQLHV